uniref:Uncharacterized protein n=1 Tax=virus sp. ctrcb4 TaxID=2825824 RepID=A0A8S5RQC9_9VIRU|nr:MAG TPA: hypothetical protein [virus sp. ctrcb4]
MRNFSYSKCNSTSSRLSNCCAISLINNSGRNFANLSVCI